MIREIGFVKILRVGLLLVIGFGHATCLDLGDSPSSDLEIPECRVGVIMPTSGGLAPYGSEGIIAARIALEDAQDQDLQCRPIIYEVDSGSTPDGANSAAVDLISPPNSVQVLVGEINSDNTAAIAGAARLANVPVIAPTASRISLTRIFDQIVRIWPSDAYEAEAMKNHILSRGIRRIAILHLQVPYGEEMASAFAEEFRESGGEVQVESYRENSVDFRPLLQRVREFEAIYLISYIEDAALILKQAYQLRTSIGHSFQFFGTSVLDNQSVIEKAGIASEGLVFAVVEPGEGRSSSRSELVAKYKNRRNAISSGPLSVAAMTPTFATYHVYDAVRLAFLASETVRGDSATRDPSLIRFLKEMPPYSGVTGEISFDQAGDLASTRTVVFKKIEDGVIEELGN